MNNSLRAGADINGRRQDGRTALMAAAKQGHRHAVETLLENKANIHLVDQNNRTALLWAAACSMQPCYDLLLETKSDATVKDSEGHDAEYFWKLRYLAQALMTDDVARLQRLISTASERPDRMLSQTLALAAQAGKQTAVELLVGASLVGTQLGRLTTQKREERAREAEESGRGVRGVLRNRPADCLFQCGHIFCMECAAKVVQCPTCRTAVVTRTKAFL